MKIINNRYELFDVIEEQYNWVKYNVKDLFNPDKKYSLKLYNSSYNDILINFFVRECITEIKQIKHPAFISFYDLDIVEFINGSKIERPIYFSTSEKHEFCSDSLKEVLNDSNVDVFLTSLFNTVDLLLYCYQRGFNTEIIQFDDLVLDVKNNNVRLKVIDIVSLVESHTRELRNNNDSLKFKEHLFKSKEILSINKFYEMLTILLKNVKNRNKIDAVYNYMEKHLLLKNNRYNINEILDEYKELKQVIKDTIDKKFVHLVNKEDKSEINFYSAMIGRRENYNILVNNIRQFEAKLSHNKIIIVKGEEGVGKTRFLKEIDFFVRMTARKHLYYSGVNNNQKIFELLFSSISNEISSNLLSKYGEELVKVVPELQKKGIKPSRSLSEANEQMRLFRRLIQFLNEFCKDQMLYIFVDDFDKADQQFVDFLNFFLAMPGKNNFLFVLSETKHIQKKNISEILGWTGRSDVEIISLLRLNINEIGEYVQNILSVKSVPISYIAKIFKTVGGIPAFIEQLLIRQFNSGEIYEENGQYYFDKADFEKVVLKSSYRSILEDLVKDLTKDEKRVLKCMSLFNKMISLEIIEKIFENDMENIMLTLMRLVDRGIFQVQLDDTGYTYVFSDIKLKNYLYVELDLEEKEIMHSQIINALEKYYSDKEERLTKGLPLYEEMADHYIGAGEIDIAIKKLICFSEEIQERYGEFQSIYLWERAYGLFSKVKNKDQLYVCFQLAKAYELIGKSNQAVKILKDIRKCEDIDFEISCFARMLYCKILLQREELELINKEIEYIEKNKDLLKDSLVLFEMCEYRNALHLKKREYDEILMDSAVFLEKAEERNLSNYIGVFYNQIGLSLLYIGQIQSAEAYLLRAVAAFKDSKEKNNLARPLNNLGLIHAEYYYNFEKALYYYEEALKYAREYSRSIVVSILLINIGQIHLSKTDYDEAKNCLIEAVKIAEELEDLERIFSAELNLAFIYLRTGDFRNCFRYIQKFSSIDKDVLKNREDLVKYYAFLTEFAYMIYDNEKMEKYKKLVQVEHNDFERYYLYEVLTWNNLQKYYNNTDKNYEDLLLFMNRIIKTPYHGLIRQFLLRMAYISLMKREYQLFQTAMDLDTQFADKFETKFHKNYKKMLEFINTDNLAGLEKIVNSKSLSIFFDLRHNALVQLSERLYERNEYYQSINGFIKIVYFIVKIIKGIDSKAYQKDILRCYHIGKALIQIQNIKAKLDNNYIKIPEKEILKLEDIEKVYSSFKLEELFNNKKFVNSIKIKSKWESSKEETTGELITNLGENSYENIEKIKSFILKQTYGERCAIVILGQETEEFAELIKNGKWVKKYRFNEFLPYLQDNEIGIILKKNIFNEQQLGELLKEDAMGGMFVPIYKNTRISHNNKSQIERRTSRVKFEEELIGFIFIETNNLLNNFDIEHLKMMHVISHILYMELRNYQLKMTSSIDKLTHVFTRKYLEKEFSDVFSKYSRTNESFSVIMADIDKFKNVNDIFGHQTGDKILRRVSSAIKRNLRNSDIIGRYGGEEFVIVLPECSSEEAMIVAEKIRKDIEKNLVIDEEYSITISQGISSFPEHTQIKEELIPKADQALYYAKDNGRNQSYVWNESLKIDNSRMDKLEGIITGNIVQDQRMALVMMEIVDLISINKSKKDKYFILLGRLIEYIEAWQGGLLLLDKDFNIEKRYYRERHIEHWIENISINENNLTQVAISKKGQYLIDWDSVADIELKEGQPNWQSIVSVPIIKEGNVVGVMFFNVPTKEREFDYKAYNFLLFVGKIIAGII